MAGSMIAYLDQLLNIHWLRPETALWRTFDCLLMETYANLSGLSLDLGCGDGTMSFIMAGGKIRNYDVFLEAAELDNFNAGVDIYNSSPSLALDLDTASVRHRFSYGIDHKQGLIDKAKRYRALYRHTLVHDLNHALPLPGGSVDSAFSNILYWLDDLNSVLSNWNEVLAPTGRLYLFVPSASFRERMWLYYKAPHAGERKYLNVFDRGYAGLIHHCLSSDEWAAVFERSGFSIVHHHRYLSPIVAEIWNVGTRPIAPLLINMAIKLSSEDRAAVKRDWVAYFARFFRPIIEGEFDRELSEEEGAFHFFVLEKR